MLEVKVFPKPLEDLSSEIFLLKQKLKDYEYHTRNIEMYEKEIERLFIGTNGILLLTIPGIGLITAAETFCEMGDLSYFTNAGQLIKKAGAIYIAMGNKFLKVAFAMLTKGKPFKWDNPEYNYKEEVFKKLTLPLAA